MHNYEFLTMIIFLCRIGLAHIGRVGSVVVTVSISVERYLNCCHPNDKFMFKSLLLPAPIIFSILYNVPKFFEISSCTISENVFDNSTKNITEPEMLIASENVTMTVDVSEIFDFISRIPTTPKTNVSNDETNNSMFGNITKDSRVSLDEFDACIDGYQITWLRNNWWYIVIYLGWSKFFLVEFLPWLIVIILTVCTTKTLKNFQINRDRLLNRSQRPGSQGNRAQRTSDEGNKS